jgi:hypothetical protein
MQFRVIKDTFVERIHFFSMHTKIVPLFTEKRTYIKGIRVKKTIPATYIRNDGDALHTFHGDSIFELFPALHITPGQAKVIDITKIENGYVIREIPCEK